MSDPRLIHSDRRFVTQGLLYVFSALAFMGFLVTSAVILGPRITEYRTLSFGVAGIAMIFVVVGVFLLVSFDLRRWRSMQKLSAPGRSHGSRGLWDDQLDG